MLFVYFVPLLSLLEKSVQAQQVSLYDCGYVKECHKYPSDCTSSEDCDVIVTWRPNNTNPVNSIYFEVSTKKSSNYVWVANSLNVEDGSMAGSSGEICIFNGTTGFLRGFKADAKGIPPTYYDNLTDVVLHSVEMVDGTLLCRYSRSIAVTEQYMKSLDQSLFIVNSFGTSLEDGIDITQHEAGDYRYSAQAIQISAFNPIAAPECNNETEYCTLETNRESFLCHSIATYTPDATSYVKVLPTPSVSTGEMNRSSHVISHTEVAITTTMPPLVLECTIAQFNHNSIFNIQSSILVHGSILPTSIVKASANKPTPYVVAPSNSMHLVASSVAEVTASRKDQLANTNQTVDQSPSTKHNEATVFLRPARNFSSSTDPSNTHVLKATSTIRNNMHISASIQSTPRLIKSPSTTSQRQKTDDVVPTSHFKNLNVVTARSSEIVDLRNSSSGNMTNTNQTNCIFDTCNMGATLHPEYALLLVGVLVTSVIFYR